ncbi:MAG: recombinase family protein [Alistipes sp.]|nr:recombinase family protein [Alistipes sp.]
MFQKTYTDSNFHRHNTQDMSKTFYITEHHEPIVSREIFEAVGALIQQRAAEKSVVRGNGKYQTRYEFSGKIICGECGGTFKRRIHDHGSEIAWVCTTHIDDIRQCSMKYIRDDALKAAITTMVNKLIFGRKLILAPYLAALRKHNANEAEIQKLKSKLKKEADMLMKYQDEFIEKIVICDR